VVRFRGGGFLEMEMTSILLGRSSSHGYSRSFRGNCSVLLPLASFEEGRLVGQIEEREEIARKFIVALNKSMLVSQEHGQEVIHQRDPLRLLDQGTAVIPVKDLRQAMSE
jgi:hypothetical protein